MSRAHAAAVASVFFAFCAFTPLAHAQATRTWVSGVGDDANPCSRTAPCKTFAGAISKTATAGEIDTLDPGGFGAVTITKSITINGISGLSGIAASLFTGIIVNASGSVVILRNLDINGMGNGIRGIRILAAGDVHVEHCKIYGFANQGIQDDRTSGHLLVTDTIVSNNAQTGILALAGSASSLNVSLDGVHMHSNGNAGFAITNGTRAVVTHSSASSNTHGFYADGGSVLDLEESSAFGNVGTGLNAQTGATIRIFNTTISANDTGLSTAAGSILSYGLNRIAGNTAGNGPPGTIAVQ
jgi:hypothetical protein